MIYEFCFQKKNLHHENFTKNPREKQRHIHGRFGALGHAIDRFARVSIVFDIGCKGQLLGIYSLWRIIFGYLDVKSALQLSSTHRLWPTQFPTLARHVVRVHDVYWKRRLIDPFEGSIRDWKAAAAWRCLLLFAQQHQQSAEHRPRGTFFSSFLSWCFFDGGGPTNKTAIGLGLEHVPSIWVRSLAQPTFPDKWWETASICLVCCNADLCAKLAPHKFLAERLPRLDRLGGSAFWLVIHLRPIFCLYSMGRFSLSFFLFLASHAPPLPAHERWRILWLISIEFGCQNWRQETRAADTTVGSTAVFIYEQPCPWIFRRSRATTIFVLHFFSFSLLDEQGKERRVRIGTHSITVNSSCRTNYPRHGRRTTTTQDLY